MKGRASPSRRAYGSDRWPHASWGSGRGAPRRLCEQGRQGADTSWGKRRDHSKSREATRREHILVGQHAALALPPSPGATGPVVPRETAPRSCPSEPRERGADDRKIRPPSGLRNSELAIRADRSDPIASIQPPTVYGRSIRRTGEAAGAILEGRPSHEPGRGRAGSAAACSMKRSAMPSTWATSGSRDWPIGWRATPRPASGLAEADSRPCESERGSAPDRGPF